MFEMIQYEKIDRVAKIVINRPKVFNALSTQTKHELVEAFAMAKEDPEIGCAILTGAGDKAFCSGQDLSESMQLDPADAEKWVRSFEELYIPMRNFDKPLVAVVNGVSAGSGFQIALLCDIRLCSSNARFAMTEIDVGFACVTGSSLMWDILGKSVTTDMCLSGRFMYAEEALQRGVVSAVYSSEELEAASLAYCRKLAEKPPTAVRMDKQWFQMLSEERFRKSVEFAIVAHTEGYKAGEPNAYQEKFFAERKAKKK